MQGCRCWYVYMHVICKLISNFRMLIKVWNSISLKFVINLGLFINSSLSHLISS